MERLIYEISLRFELVIDTARYQYLNPANSPSQYLYLIIIFSHGLKSIPYTQEKTYSPASVLILVETSDYENDRIFTNRTWIFENPIWMKN